MASYDYECLVCSTAAIIQRPMSEDEKEYSCEAESCAGKLRRIFAATPTIFKARGFYKTENMGK